MDRPEQTDAELAARIQDAQDATAFDELLARHQRPVLNFCYRLLGNASDAEDVAQEVFVRVWQHLADYDPRQKFTTWLFALARHAAIDHLRWRKRHPSEPLAADAVLPDRVSVTGDVQAREIGDQIAAAVAELPEDQRTALVLAEYHGLSQAEIGEIMHCSAKSVESRLYRAKQTLRGRLARWLA
jgi:RNA polymerase sigma factor (sigma-70 family)